MYRIKLHHVDSAARCKGYRRGMVLRVIGADPTCNPDRGPLYIVRRRGGEQEGFYADQVRSKPWHLDGKLRFIAPKGRIVFPRLLQRIET